MFFRGWEVSLQVWEGHAGPHLYFHTVALTIIKLFVGNWYDLLLGVSLGLV